MSQPFHFFFLWQKLGPLRPLMVVNHRFWHLYCSLRMLNPWIKYGISTWNNLSSMFFVCFAAFSLFFFFSYFAKAFLIQVFIGKLCSWKSFNKYSRSSRNWKRTVQSKWKSQGSRGQRITSQFSGAPKERHLTPLYSKSRP